MKILLIAPHFFPDEHIGASRWNRLSKYLLRDGHELYVIASDIISDSTESNRATRLIRVNYQSSWVDRTIRFFGNAKRGLPIEQSRQNLEVNEVNKKTLLYNSIIAYAGMIARFPGVYWWSSNDIVARGVQLIKDHEIDVIIATHPFSVSLRSASILSSKSGVPWIADMRDGWSNYYFGEYQKGSVLHKALQKLEKYYLGSARSVVSINKKLADLIHVPTDKIDIIPNVFDPEDQIPIDYQVVPSDKINFTFAGSVHDKHCWELFFKGISCASEKVNIDRCIVNYYGGYFGKVRTKQIRFGISESLIVDNGYLEKSKLMAKLAKADILLVFGFSGAHGDSVTTGKIFDYMESGKPILVFGSPTSELAELVLRTGIGRVISTVAQSTEAVVKLIESKKDFIDEILRNRNEVEILKYSASHAARHYVQTIKKRLKRIDDI